jgi:hypothetical protein
MLQASTLRKIDKDAYWRKYINKESNNIDVRRICMPMYRTRLLQTDSFSTETLDSDEEYDVELEECVDEQRMEYLPPPESVPRMKANVASMNDKFDVNDVLELIDHEMDVEKKKCEGSEKSEKESDTNRESQDILNWFIRKLDEFQESKMLVCNECFVSLDRTSACTIPTSTEALKYVEYETTSHMASIFDEEHTALYDKMVAEDKIKLCCWPFQLVQFAVTHIVHAFHAKHVMCGTLDTELNSEAEEMSLSMTEGNMEVSSDKVRRHADVVLVICRHEEDYALLEIETKKRKVTICGSLTFDNGSKEAMEFWMQCIVLILRRYWPNELESDASNILLSKERRMRSSTNKGKDAWRVTYNVVYAQLHDEDSGAVAINQLAWRLKQITRSKAPEEVVAQIGNPKTLKTQNRSKAYKLLCYLMERHSGENMWKCAKDKHNGMQSIEDDGGKDVLMSEMQREANEANDVEMESKMLSEKKTRARPEVEKKKHKKKKKNEDEEVLPLQSAEEYHKDAEVLTPEMEKEKKNGKPLCKEPVQEKEIDEPDIANEIETWEEKNVNAEMPPSTATVAPATHASSTMLLLSPLPLRLALPLSRLSAATRRQVCTSIRSFPH